MIWLKQSTAVDVGVGPFVDSTDGVTAETALTISQADVRLKKGAGNWAQKNESTSATHEENGWYEVKLDATDTGTLGELILAVAESGALPVWVRFMVVPANVYDSLIGGSDVLQADVTQLLGTAWLTPATAGTPDVNTKTITDGAISAAKLAADTITDAKVASDVTIASVTGSVGSVSGLTASLVHSDLDDIQARLPAALAADGSIKASLQSILATAFTEGAAGRIAAAFKQFFNVASSTGTVDLIPVVNLTNTVTTYTGNTPQTGDVFPLASTEIADIKAKTDLIPSDPADASDVAALIAAIPAAIGARIADGTITYDQCMMIVAALGGGKTSGGGTATNNFRNPADTKTRISATVDASGNRSAVALDFT